MQLTLPQDLFGEVHLAFLSTWPNSYCIVIQEKTDGDREGWSILMR